MPVLEIDIECQEIEEVELQVFRRGVVDVGDDPVGVFLLDDLEHALEVPLDSLGSEPTRH
jgi:hypothetical protein